MVSVDSDAAQAKVACSIGHLCKRRIEKASSSSKLIHKSVNSFVDFVIIKLKGLEIDCRHLFEMTQARKETMRVLELTSSLTLGLQNNEEKFSVMNYLIELKNISDNFISETNPKIIQLHQKNVKEDTLNLEWNSLSKGVKTPSQIAAPAIAKTQVERLRDSWQHLYRDRATRSLSYNDEQFHVLEKIKITETGRRLKTLLEVDCIPPFNQLAEVLGDWYKIAQTVYLQTMILQKDVFEYGRSLESFAENLSLEIIQYSEEIKSCLQSNKAGVLGNHLGDKDVMLNGRLKTSFKEADKLNKEIINIIKEYSGLVDHFSSVSINKIGGNEDEVES